jgi:RNA polymerase sigma factor (sigma-70 family)
MAGACGTEAMPASAASELAEVLEQERRMLRGLLRTYKIPPQDAEDILHEAVTLAVLKWAEIRRPAAWLYGTLRNRCIIYRRAQRRERARLVHLDAEAAELLLSLQAPVEHEALERRVVLGELARGLARHHRRVLVLRYQLGMCDEEIAVATGLLPGSIRRTCHRACAAMRQADLAARWRGRG